MFTGIIAATGRIQTLQALDQDVQLEIHAGELDLDDVALGDSIAVNGVCLTVVALTAQTFTVVVSTETLRCTQGLDQAGLAVNLEKALRLSDRLGGHLVSGHVDGVGVVLSLLPVGDCMQLLIRAPADIARFIATKGSLTVNGVSLTTNQVMDAEVSINLIPHTLQNTNLHSLTTGSKVNLEVDVIARYCERMMSYQNNS